MDPEGLYSGSSGGGTPNFAFAFNDSNFSDRILRIEVMAAPSDVKPDGDCTSSIAEWARHRKRRRADYQKGAVVEAACKMVEFLEGPEEQFMIGTQPDIDDSGPFDGADDEPIAMVEESPTYIAMVSSPVADDHLPAHEVCGWNLDSTTVLRVKTLHISSAILAAKSPFFYKLFSNGMRESEQRDVTLRISASEEAALMDMLQFMYSGRVQASTPLALLDVLMAADKFEVASCMRHCSKLLRNLPMTPESALLYLDLPSSVLLADAVQPLTDAAKGFLASRFKDITRFQEEVMNLPLAGIEAVLSSDDLQVASEDAVYDFVIKWAKVHYPKIDDRREILGTKLVSLIRFPMMTSRKLRKVLTCTDLDHDVASKLVLDGLFYKAEVTPRQRQLALEESMNKRYSERAYKYRPVKVVEFHTPHQQCLVFLDLKKEECMALSPAGRVYSQAFHLGGQGFFLSAHCNLDQQSSFPCFGLFLGMQEKGLVSFAVDYEFAARSKPSRDFTVKQKGTYKFTGGKAVGYRNLFSMAWAAFTDEDCIYFIDNVLHLRAELTIRP